MPQKANKSTNYKELLLRVIASIILIPAIIFLVLKGGVYFKGLLIMVTLLIGFEYKRLTALTPKTRSLFTAGVIATMWWLFAISFKQGFIDAIQVSAIAVATIYGAGLILKNSSLHWAGFGVGYVGVPMFSLALIGLHPEAGGWLLWLLFMVWATDTGAFIFGKIIGGPKLSPKISPNKTWAGAIGGLLSAAAVGAGMAMYAELGNPFYLAAWAGFLSIWGQVGDLTESFIKRKFGYKDSGFMIPGHGGIMDRTDSILFVAPILALLLEFGIL